MSRPQRYANRIEFWTNDQQLQGLELLIADGLSDRATHLRQALALYLRHCGIAPASRPALNGHAQQTRVEA